MPQRINISTLYDIFSLSAIKLRSASEVSECFIYRFLLDHRKLLLNVNCGVKIVYDMYVASHH